MKRLNMLTAQSTVGMHREWAYNAVDCLATLEICETLLDTADEVDKRTHDFYMAAQSPARQMSLRGIKCDPFAVQEALRDLRLEIAAKQRDLAKDERITVVWDKTRLRTGQCSKSSRKDGKHKWPRGVEDGPDKKCECCGQSRLEINPFNANSPDDVKHLLYDLLGMKKQHDKDGKVTTGKEALQRLQKKYKKQADLLEAILDLKDVIKQKGFMEFRQTADERFMSQFKVGVTTTGRWRSSKDNFGFGKNAQNVAEKHRHVFVADPGYMIVYADLKQAESNIVAHVAGDEQYIKAHAEGDTHTFVTRLVWPEGVGGEKWTGDIKKDKAIAKKYRPPWDNVEGHDYRFQSKAVQHGSNLGLTVFGMAIQKRIPVAAARDGQRRYFKAFPGIRKLQAEVRKEVESQTPIVTPLGIRFRLFGRPKDPHTYKQGLAIRPQSMVGHIINIGCWKIWWQLEPKGLQLLAQVHDALLFQVPEGRYDLIYEALELMRVPVIIEGIDGKERVCCIGTEAAVGKNWGHYDPEHNPDGVREIEFENKEKWSFA